MDRRDLNPAQRRLLEELLAVDAPRPAADPALADRLRRVIDEGLAPAADLVPPGEPVVLSKSALAALACDGRFLDHREGDFTWSTEIIRGTLTHLAVEIDWATGHGEDPATIVDRAWSTLLERPGGLAAFLATCDPLEAATTRAEARQLVTDLRDLWPPIPARWHPRLEHPVSATFAGGAIQVRGRPDLTIGSAARDRAQMVVVDLKTGWRRPQRDRSDLRLYGLLLTLKYGVAPFRVATYYVTEGAWDVEDVTPDTLEAAAREVVDGATRAVHLVHRRPPDRDLRLVPGAACRWCGRAPRCPAASTDTSVRRLPGPLSVARAG